MEAEANAKKSEALVKKMQVQVQKEAIENEDRIARIRSEVRKDKDRSESQQQDIIARAIVH